MAVDIHQAEAAILWRVTGFGRERHLPGTPYWWDNRAREPVATCVIQYTVAGTMKLRDGDGLHDVPSGHAALFTYREDSAYGLTPECTVPYVCAWLNLGGAGLREHWDLLRSARGPVIAIADEAVATIPRLMALAHPRAGTDPALMAQAVHGFVIDLTTSVRRTVSAAQSPVERAIDELLRNPTYPWSLKRLADQYGCSREHFTRVFRRRVGQSPGSWLAQERQRRALHLLRHTNLPVAVIAEQSGYSSTHTLARQVRTLTGFSPRTLRRRTQ